MVKLMLQLNTRFSKEDKEACLPVVEKMAAYAEFVKENGALGLEDLMPDEDSPFLKAALPLVYNGVDMDDSAQIMTAMILAANDGAAGLLARLMMAEGITALQYGPMPRLLRITLLSMLGEEYVLDFLQNN